MSHRFTIDALKELIAARRDAEQGLRVCAEHVREPRLRVLVMSHLQDCAQALQELQSLVRLLGGDRAATERSAREPPAGASEKSPAGATKRRPSGQRGTPSGGQRGNPQQGATRSCLPGIPLPAIAGGSTCAQLLLVTRMELFSTSASAAGAARSRSTGTRWTIRCRVSCVRSSCDSSRM